MQINAADNSGIKYVYNASNEHAVIVKFGRDTNHSGTRWVGKHTITQPRG